MPVTIKNAAIKYKDPTTGEYKTVDAISDGTTAERIAAITATANAADAAITATANAADAAMTAKAAQTIASIPEDYTELNNEVTELKADFSQLDAVMVFSGQISIETVVGTPNSYIRHADGLTASSEAYNSTDYVDVSLYSKIKYKRNGITQETTATGIAFYDKNKTYISGVHAGVAQAERAYLDDLYETGVPNNAKYARFTTFTDTETYGNFELYGISKLVENTVPDEILCDGNLLNYDLIENGYINASGNVTSYSSLWRSDYIPIKAGKVYLYNVYASYYAFYDEDRVLVASYSTMGDTKTYTPYIKYLDVPEGAVYFRCTFTSNQKTQKSAWVSNIPETPEANSKNIDGVFPYTLNPDNPCDYSELTVRAFSKVVCIGDSLTYGYFNDSGSATNPPSATDQSLRYSYPSNFERITGIDTTNMGSSGLSAPKWYSSHQNDDFSEFDLAIVFLGVNDSAQSVSDENTLTAMQNIVTMLSEARNNMCIAICSTIPAYDGSGYQSKGQLILNWAKSLNNPNIIPLDLAKYSHVLPRTSYVAGHLSALGYYQMALDIARYISWYIDKNRRDFRFIQFIGSDATYSGD